MESHADTAQANGTPADAIEVERARLLGLRSDEASPPAAGNPERKARRLKQESPPPRDRTFNALVRPLEIAGDEYGEKRLNGWGLELCLAAFYENPRGFATCARRAHGKWEATQRGELRPGDEPIRFPLGLLIYMVGQGEHLIDDDDLEVI